jgi:hypothetical protein
MSPAMNATANFQKLNAAIDQYTKAFKVDLGKMVRYVSVGLIKDVAQGNPVLTGRSRAGWLPFLWKMKVAINMKSKKKTKGKKKDIAWETEVAKAQQEGLNAGDYKYDFESWKPFAMIINNVDYIVYLIYGVRKGAQMAIAIEEADLSAVSSQNDPDWFFKAIDAWTKKMLDAVKRKDRKTFR